MTREEALSILGLTAQATSEHVKAAYRTLARKTHPDKGGSTEAFLKVKQAYELLTGKVTQNRIRRPAARWVWQVYTYQSYTWNPGNSTTNTCGPF